MSTLTRLTHALIPTGALPQRDRAADVADGTPAELATALQRLLGAEQVLTRAADLVRYASDASPYRMIPQVVVIARDHRDIAAVLRYAGQHGRHVTFRSAGTSLNGQAQGDDILVDVRRHFAYAAPEDDGRVLRCGPGIVIARANALNMRHGRKLGPDPASSGAATVGGVVANNASGMAAGVKDNSYNTLLSMRLVLPSGTIVDTADPNADRDLEAAEPDLVAGLRTIKADIESNPALAARIRTKFQIKNTNGYRLDAFLDEDSPAQILRRLLVGSQGTLGFVDECRFRTVPIGKYQATALLRFADLGTAAGAIEKLIAMGANTGELMDNPSLRATAHIEGAPEWMQRMGTEDAGVVTDFRSDDKAEVEDFVRRAVEMLGDSILDGEFTSDPKLSNGYWRVRSGVLPALGGVRPSGTSVLAEDVCVPPDRVAEAAVDIRRVLEEHDYPGSIQGHASAGNLHFVLVLDTNDDAQIKRYVALMEALVELIIDKYDGALKGEHATGRNMAPYVEREWGAEIVGYFRRVKQLLDPKGLLNPGVLLNDDPDANIQYLKGIPVVEPELDKCIECGFCEPVCPSRDVTTTPRQRIVLRREMLRQGAGSAVAQELAHDYEYSAVETCAGDSSCGIACPVDIDTGHAMKQLRHAEHGRVAETVAAGVARRWGLTESVARKAIGLAGGVTRVVGNRPLTALTDVARGILGKDLIPRWIGTAPRPAPELPMTIETEAAAVYFPACINRIFGAPKGAEDTLTVTQAVVALAERAGKPLFIPDDVAGVCCSTPFHSKGYDRANRMMANRLVDSLWRWSDGGRRPIIVDASSCTLGILREVVPYLSAENAERHAQLRITDALTWAREDILPTLPERETHGTAVLHPTCSMTQLNLTEDLLAVAGAAAERVVVPSSPTCCGFAGDRGFLHPELTESATRVEAEEVRASGADQFLSGNRTCELGMEHATHAPYEHALIALERATR